MIRVFLNASVLFSASYSETGASRDLLREAIRGNLKIVVSRHVLEEAERNLVQKAPEALPAFRELLTLVAAEVAEKPALEELKQAATYINLKDAPIVATAAKAKVDYLVTWDQKHFIDDPKVAEWSGLMILTPDKLMAIVKKRAILAHHS
ncbi:MAG: putative toxin-antitoxin system toxin component, PIN family [Chloroflexi bacterium]|nr:putative toxin-antitoxin system toxin component, PIN family [Chloroflexota bacterium]